MDIFTVKFSQELTSQVVRDPVLPAEEEVVPTLPGPQLESSEDSIPPGSKDTRSQKPSVRNN